MGELSECDEVTGAGRGGDGGEKNWQSVGAITTAALTNQARGVRSPPPHYHAYASAASAVHQRGIPLAQVSL
jgi:hypothetical protein